MAQCSARPRRIVNVDASADAIRFQRLSDQRSEVVATDRAASSEQSTVDARSAQQIDLLVEHRQALITAAVTGEFEVPGVAA